MNTSGKAFEAELRGICERAYRRPSREGNPLAKIIRGESDAEATRGFFAERFDSVLIESQMGFPRLLENCVPVEGRVQLWGVIFAEYGRGHTERSAPSQYQKMLIGLGVPPGKCEPVLAREKPAVAKRLSAIAAMTWPQLLARTLVRTTIAPKVFPAIEKALAGTVDSGTLDYLKAQRERDTKALDILFGLVAKEDSAEAQQAIRNVANAFFEEETDFCCDLGAVA